MSHIWDLIILYIGIRGELDVFERRTSGALQYGAEKELPMLGWLKTKTENPQIHAQMEVPIVRRQLSRIIASYMSSKFFSRYQQGIINWQAQNIRRETALQVAEQQMDNPIAGYDSQAHPEVAAYIGEDWGADHTENLRRTSTSLGQIITDPSAIYLEVIAPELILLWIMEDLRINETDASLIQDSIVATRYRRLVLEDETISEQVWHYTNAHPREEETNNAKEGR